MTKPYAVSGIIVALLLCIGCGAGKKSEKSATEEPSKTRPAFKTLTYLYNISGKKTLAGIHNREPNHSPAKWTEQIKETTGKYPALWSGDFLFQAENINNRKVMIKEALKQWKNGAVINIMWHACNPALTEPCAWDKKGVLSKLTDAQWAELITDGTTLNNKWKTMMDEVSGHLQYLKMNNVEVLFRPLHEMNQGTFWWGGRPGPTGTRKLWQITHDYLTKAKGLNNLIWVWDIQDFNSLAADAENYNPGDNYFDIAALDIYDDKSGYTNEKYSIMLKASGGKPIAIGECQRLPTAEKLKEQPKWTFFMSWSELTFSKNSTAEIRSLYQGDNISTLDDLPGW